MIIEPVLDNHSDSTTFLPCRRDGFSTGIPFATSAFVENKGMEVVEF
jgi:hypothetical protein